MTLDDPRLVGNVQTVALDQEDQIQSRAVEAVLDFMAGAGDTGPCALLDDAGELDFDGDWDLERGEPLDVATIGISAGLCDFGGRVESGDLVLPDGERVPLPAGDRERSTGTGVQVVRFDSIDDDAVTYEVWTFPGAAAGSYRFEVETVDGVEVLPVRYHPISEPPPDYGPRVFEFNRYTNGIEIPPAEPGQAAMYGLVGFPSNASVGLALYRTVEPTVGDDVNTASFELVDEFSVDTDDRGEASIVFPIDDSSAGHCLYLRDVASLQEVELFDGVFRDVAGRDSRVLCVGP